MKTIAIANSKGGCGKTTLSINLAECIARHGYSVVLVDFDVGQVSSSGWDENRNNPTPSFDVVEITDPKILKEYIKGCSDEFDYLIIDGSPKVDRGLGAVVANSDLVIIPVICSDIDLKATRQVVDILEARWEVNLRPSARFLLSCVDRRATRQTRSALDSLEGGKISVMQSRTTQLTTWRKWYSEGGTVFDHPGNDAVIQISAIYDEIKNIFLTK